MCDIRKQVYVTKSMQAEGVEDKREKQLELGAMSGESKLIVPGTQGLRERLPGSSTSLLTILHVFSMWDRPASMLIMFQFSPSGEHVTT